MPRAGDLFGELRSDFHFDGRLAGVGKVAEIAIDGVQHALLRLLLGLGRQAGRAGAIRPRFTSAVQRNVAGAAKSQVAADAAEAEHVLNLTQANELLLACRRRHLRTQGCEIELAAAGVCVAQVAYGAGAAPPGRWTTE